MYEQLIALFQHLHIHKSIAMYIALAAITVFIALATLLVNWVVKLYLEGLVNKKAERSKKSFWPLVQRHAVFSKVPQLCAAIFLTIIIPLAVYQDLPLSHELASILHVMVLAYMLLLVTFTFSHVLDAIHSYSVKNRYLHNKPVRSYFQIIKIVAWILTGICAISLLLNKSPLVFLTSLGAISAVALLVFKDTILGFVASIQVSAYDSVRVGDWITIKDKDVDGTVLDVAVNGVKIQNFDNTIITIPTYDLVSSSVQNWRGMSESGGRRIKRSVNIDMHSIKFCNESLYTKLGKLQLLAGFLDKKQNEIQLYNAEKGADKTIHANGRHLTNIGLFRAYVEVYLQHNDKIHKGMTFLIRQLQPTATGLPLEVYVFTNDTKWETYEAIQSDIFDHLLAVLPYFELQTFQFSSQTVISEPVEAS